MINLDEDISALPLTEVAKRYRQVRAVRLEMQKQTEAVAAFEARCKDRVIEEQAVDTGFVVDGYSFVVTSKPKPVIKDWEKLVAYIAKTGRFDMLQKRLADKAVTDTENWHMLPGIERFNHKDLSVTKR